MNERGYCVGAGGDWEDDHQLMWLPSLRLGGDPPPSFFSLFLSLTSFYGNNCREFLLEVQRICQDLSPVEPFLVRRLSSILALPFWCCLSPRSFASAYVRCTANSPLFCCLLTIWVCMKMLMTFSFLCSIHLCYQSYPLTQVDVWPWVGCFAYNAIHVWWVSGACLEVVWRCGWRTIYIGSLRVTLILECQEVLAFNEPK